MSRLQLPEVTLCCVDTRSPALALMAMRASMAHCDFGRCILFSDQTAQSLDLQGIDLVAIEPLKNIDEYSRFIFKSLSQHIETSHVLVTQWDGFVIAPERWSPLFLTFDYIGAPWTQGKLRGLVGNGGFSLRSRKLLRALQDDCFEIHNPEDLSICVDHRQKLETAHGCIFADTSTAASFSHERGPWETSFGFHGAFNFPEFMNSEELHRWIQHIPDAMTRSPDMRHFIKNLLTRSDTDNAMALLNKRTHQTGFNWSDFSLKARIRAASLLK
jgi:Protein of unknown function (DUF5672)